MVLAAFVGKLLSVPEIRIMDFAIRGGCLCKAITYTIYPPSKEELAHPKKGIMTKDGKMHANHCHCDTCRNSSGALFQTLAQVPTKRIAIVDSKKSLTTYRVSDDAEREQVERARLGVSELVQVLYCMHHLTLSPSAGGLHRLETLCRGAQHR